MRIGLTGSIACGKSTVSAYLRRLGYYVADADAISRALTAPSGAALQGIRAVFGNAIFQGEALDRKKLADLVFSNPQEREKLNSILHPLIIRQLKVEMTEHEALERIVFADIPLLYECNLSPLFDAVWVVCTSEDKQIQRLCTRDNLMEEDALKRIQTQMPQEKKCALADEVISTDGSIEETQQIIQELLCHALNALVKEEL